MEFIVGVLIAGILLLNIVYGDRIRDAMGGLRLMYMCGLLMGVIYGIYAFRGGNKVGSGVAFTFAFVGLLLLIVRWDEWK